MLKLLRADIYQFLKNKIFWAELGISAIMALFILYTNYSRENQASADALQLEEIFFIFYQMIGVIIAAAIALIVGTQYSDGTIRNKIVVGHKRSDIYFSTLLVCMASSILIILIHFLLTYSVGYFLYGDFGVPISRIIVSALYITLAIMAITAIFTACAMNISNKAFSAVVSLLLILLIAYLSGQLISILDEPEMTYDSVTISADGGVQLGNMIKNPAYVSGTKRTLIEILSDLLPISQIIQICDGDFSRCDRWPLLSSALIVFVTALGFLKFRKKDIK